MSDHVALGVLTRTFPPELVDAVVADTGRVQHRHRLLPSRLVVYYVLAMALFSSASYGEVMRNLVEGLAWESGWRRRWKVPSKSAIFQARARLGPEPLVELFDRAVVPLGTPATPGAFYRDWRLVSIDGTSLDVADTEANEQAFGRPGSKGADRAAFPQLRLVGVAECGTHAITSVALDSCTTAESVLATRLVDQGAFGPGTMVLADRGFFSYSLWNKVKDTGAQLVWRMKSNAVLPVLARHDDGSFTSKIYPSPKARRHDTGGIEVRIVEYTVHHPAGPAAGQDTGQDTGQEADQTVTYRLATTIMDPQAAPAADLAALYAQRWEFETALDELKTHQRGPRVVLRSKNPDGVRQEVYGYLCVHYAIRALMATVADHHDTDPDRVSFTRSLHAARRSVRAGLGTAHRSLTQALHTVVAEIAGELLPPRRLRAAARVVKRKMSNYGLKRARHRSRAHPVPTAAVALHVLIPP